MIIYYKTMKKITYVLHKSHQYYNAFVLISHPIIIIVNYYLICLKYVFPIFTAYEF